MPRLTLVRRASAATLEDPDTLTTADSAASDALTSEITTHNLLKSDDGHVFKALQEQDGNGQSMRLFYEEMQGLKIAQFCPEYFGCKKLPESGKDWEWLEIEDITAGCESPAIMDLKMGTKKFYAVAAAKGCAASYPPEKVARQAAADLKRTVTSLGFLISGCSVPATDDGTAYASNEKFGKEATDDQAREVVRNFIKHGAGDDASQVAAAFAKQLNSLLTWFEKDHSHVFYNASLLFAYDASKPRATDRVKVRLIDFAHSWKREPEEEDISGVAYGVRTLFDVFTAFKKPSIIVGDVMKIKSGNVDIVTESNGHAGKLGGLWYHQEELETTAVEEAVAEVVESEARRVTVALALEEMQEELGQFEAPVVDWEIETRGAWSLAPFKLPKNVTAGKKCHFTFCSIKCELEFTSTTAGKVNAKGKSYPVRCK